jgi:hypothetical protein
MKSILLEFLIISRLITNEGIIIENRRPIPKRQPPEIIRFIRRPAKRGRKLFFPEISLSDSSTSKSFLNISSRIAIEIK